MKLFHLCVFFASIIFLSFPLYLWSNSYITEIATNLLRKHSIHSDIAFEFDNRAILIASSFSRPKNISKDGEESVWYQVPGSNRVDLKRNDNHYAVGVHSAYYNRFGNHVVLLILSDAGKKIKHGKWPYAHFCAFFDRNQQPVRVTSATFYTSYLAHCNWNALFASLPANVMLYRNNSFFNPRRDSPPWTIPIHDNQKLVENGHIK